MMSSFTFVPEPPRPDCPRQITLRPELGSVIQITFVEVLFH